MDAQKQQVLGFFIEEAREHLDTIERGLLNLQAVIDDSEQINELFRAAHSVKGGAAMLGFNSVQKVAHRLEDCFKILKEQPIKVDQQVEDMFLRGFDTLQQLLEQLQGPFGLQDEEAAQTVQQIEPVFVQLQDYLKSLTGGGLPADFSAQVMSVLRQMLALFKQAENATSRQQIQNFCDELSALASDTGPWTLLLQTVKRAAANPKASYKVLAPILIKELKEASEKLQANPKAIIEPSTNLRKLAGPAPIATIETPPVSTEAAVVPVSTSQPSTSPNEISIPVDPKAAAQVLIKTFNRQELVELANILIRVIKGK